MTSNHITQTKQDTNVTNAQPTRTDYKTTIFNKSINSHTQKTTIHCKKTVSRNK